MRQPRPLHLYRHVKHKIWFFTLARKGDLGGSSVLGVRIVFRRGGQAWDISYREKKQRDIYCTCSACCIHITGVPTRLLISSFAFELKIRTQAGIFTLKMSSTHWASSVFVYGEKQNKTIVIHFWKYPKIFKQKIDEQICLQHLTSLTPKFIAKRQR